MFLKAYDVRVDGFTIRQITLRPEECHSEKALNKVIAKIAEDLAVPAYYIKLKLNDTERSKK